MGSLPFVEFALKEIADTLHSCAAGYWGEVKRVLGVLHDETGGRARRLLEFRRRTDEHTYNGENKSHEEWEIETVEDWFRLARDNGENVVITVEEFSWKDNTPKRHFLITCISQPNKGTHHPHISTYVLPFDRLYPDEEHHARWRWWVAVSRMINALRGLATAQWEIGYAIKQLQELDSQR